MRTRRRGVVVGSLKQRGIAFLDHWARWQSRSPYPVVMMLTLFALLGGPGRFQGSTTAVHAQDGPTARPPVVVRPNLVTPPVFSPYDAVFRKYAGDQAQNDELIAILAAATLPESGWKPDRIGDGGKSLGLFQIHEIHGLSNADRTDPERAAAFMVPKFVEAYNEVKATRPDLSGGELASLVAGMALRPLDWTDPTSSARRNYRDSFRYVMTAALARS